MDYVITTHALCKQYGAFKALNNLTMHVPKGAIYGLVGKNGAGKTTLIRVLCGLQEPSAGGYSIYGVSSQSQQIN
ncbi:MAG: ATP-binding cassette domain-containing protein, partial [Clostridia bacterium]